MYYQVLVSAMVRVTEGEIREYVVRKVSPRLQWYKERSYVRMWGKSVLGRGNSTWGKGTDECGMFEEQNVNMAREELT